MEAYEALRDPQSRVRYDAESLASDRSESQARWSGDTPGDGARFGSAAAGIWQWAEVLVRRLGGPVVMLAIAILALLASVGSLAIGSSRVAERDRLIDGLHRRLQAASAPTASAQPPPKVAALPPVYHGELLFPNGSTELDAATRARLDAVTAELQRAIGGLPSGSAWLVSVESGIDRAADRRRAAGRRLGAGAAAGRRDVRSIWSGTAFRPSGWPSASTPAPLAPAADSPQAVAFELLCCG